MTRHFVCCVLSYLAASAVAAEPFTAGHLVRIDRVGAPAVSPAGDRVVYADRNELFLIPLSDFAIAPEPFMTAARSQRQNDAIRWLTFSARHRTCSGR